jgi:hypothetical protein
MQLNYVRSDGLDIVAGLGKRMIQRIVCQRK